MPELVASENARFPLRDSGVLVGRHSEDGTYTPDIDLGSLQGGRTVSRRAVHIYRDGRDWRVKVDAAARSVTIVAGQPLLAEQDAPLHDGDIIKLGAISLTFLDRNGPAGSDPNATMVNPSQASAELRGGDDQLFPLTGPPGRTLTLGRRSADLTYHPDIDLHNVQGGNTVSRRHGELFTTERGWILRVQGDVTNPTYLNQQLLEPGHEILLTDGDQLRLGRALVTFHQRRQANYVDREVIELLVDPQGDLTVEPGRERSMAVMLTNFTGRVDWFLFDVSGVPASWCRWLLPDGSPGQPPLARLLTTTAAVRAPDARATVTLIFSPPRLATTRAGRYPLLITATSQGGERLRRATVAQLEVLPFQNLSIVADPLQVRGSRSTYHLVVQNEGNAPVAVALRPETSDQLRVQVQDPDVTVANGDARRVPVDVRVKRRPWFGADRTHGAMVVASSGDQKLTQDLRLVCPPRIPHWIQAVFSRANSIFKPIVVPLVVLAIALGLGFLVLRPPDVRLSAEPTSVAAGNDTVLKWQVDRGSGGPTLEFNGNKQDIDPRQDRITVTPQKQTEYKLTARNWFGLTTTTSVVVDVLRIVSFTATPDTLVKEADPVALQWETEGATTITLDGASVVKGPLTVHPTGTTTYHLVATNAAGTRAEADAQVKLAAPKIARFERAQDRPQVYPGDPVLLSWTAQGFDRLTLSATMDDQVLNGSPLDVKTATSVTVRPLQSGSYSLVASNTEDQRDEQRVSVTVTPPRIAAFTVDQDSLPAGQATRLSWRVEGANDRMRAAITPDIGDVDGTGARPVSPSQTTTYTLSVTTPDGTTLPPQKVTVRVLPSVRQFVASAQTIVQGQSVDLSWSVQAADRITVTKADGRPVGTSTAAEASVTDTPDQSTTYLLKATNQSGDAPNAAVSVTVTLPPPPPSFPSFPPDFNLGDPNVP